MAANTVIIDLRDESDYLASHHPNAANIPARQLFELSHELPSTHFALQLIGTDAQLAEAKHYFADKPYQIDNAIPPISDANWVCKQPIFHWQPSTLIQDWIDHRQSELQINLGRALDIACGAGRDSLALASAGWQMTAVDYSEDSISRLQRSSARCGVTIDAKRMNLETPNFAWPSEWREQFDLIHVARYLHRPLLPTLPSLLKPKGILLYQTFMQGAQHVGPCRPRNPKFLLEPNEVLLTLGNGLINEHLVHTLPDGRPLSVTIWQKA
ncbi:MAG: methyltransferase domain-containing protein [Gammaproteobacteria bacterium]|nr:methyltransferase domain-containing protein [Gammaproteobacteria bacterium]